MGGGGHVTSGSQLRLLQGTYRLYMDLGYIGEGVIPVYSGLYISQTGARIAGACRYSTPDPSLEYFQKRNWGWVVYRGLTCTLLVKQ